MHLLRFKAADHLAGRPEASRHRCDGMPGRMLAPATTVVIMALAMPVMTGVASPVHVVVHTAPPQLCFTPRMRCRIRRRGRLHAVVGGHLVCHRADLSQLLSLRIVYWRNWVLTLDDIVAMLYEMRVCLRCQRHWWSTLRLTWAGSSLIMARN